MLGEIVASQEVVGLSKRHVTVLAAVLSLCVAGLAAFDQAVAIMGTAPLSIPGGPAE